MSLIESFNSSIIETLENEATTVKSRAQRDNEDKTLIAYAMVSIPVAFLLVMLVPISCYVCYLYCQSRKSTPPTESPKIPEWLKNQKNIKTTEISDRRKLSTKPFFQRTRKNTNIPETEFTLPKLQKILNGIYNKTEQREFGTLKSGTCLIQIAKPGFKCARKPAEFTTNALNGAPHHYTFQMFGRDVIQATWLHLENRKVLAGVTIYIKSPYLMTVEFSKTVLWSLLANEPNLFPEQTFKENMVSVPLPKRKPLKIPPFKNHDAVSKSLIVNFCKVKNKPVMLGKKYGLMVHMEWDTEQKAFQYSECEKCHKDMEHHEDEPPSYQYATHHLLSEY